MVILRLFTQFRFVVGLIIMVSVLFISFTYERLFLPMYPKYAKLLLYDDNFNLIAKAPYPPSSEYPFGSDMAGFPYEMQLIPVMKEAIGIAVLAAVFRLLLSLICGMILATFKRGAFRAVRKILDAFQYVPATILAFIVIAPVSLDDQSDQLMLIVAVLTFVALPNLSTHLATEIREVQKREFIEASRIFGGGYFHVFRHHILPFLKGKLVILFNQQFIQVLVLMVALALLYVSVSDLTGMISSNQEWMWVQRWFLLTPAFGVFIIVVSVQLMTSAIRRLIDGEDRRPRKRVLKKEKEAGAQQLSEEVSFQSVHQKRAEVDA